MGQNFSLVCSFNGTNGANPAASLVQMPNGLLYGTTENGGVNGYGTMFQLTSTGGLTSVGVFNLDGTLPANPLAALLPIDDKTFYTTTVNGGPTNSTYHGGPGLIFEIKTNGTIATLAAFGTNALQSHPHGAPVLGPDKNFYGTTRSGNANSDGVVYQFMTNGILNTLYAPGTNNYSGYNDGFDAPLIVGADGKLYGTASGTGTNNLGWVFSITTSGKFTKLASFNSTNGANPMAPLIQTGDGKFYGTTANGGAYNLGTVFQMTTNGIITTLASFSGANGANPQAALLVASDGNFYGTTYSGGTSNLGTIFQMNPVGKPGRFISFTGTNGANPSASLIQAQDGRLYGTTFNGGISNNGVVFSVGLPPTLSIIGDGANVVLTWPASATGYLLEFTTNLLPASVWRTNSMAPIIIGGQDVIINQLTGTPLFYRLFSP